MLWRGGRITAILVGGVLSVDCTQQEPSALVDTPSAAVGTQPDLLVAFIGDQSVSPGARAVLELVRDESADACIIAGDLGYEAGFEAWRTMVEEILPPDLPVFGCIGNHDSQWKSYRSWFMTRVEGEWSGNYGVDSAHLFRGLFFVLSGAGTTGKDSEHAAYAQAELSASAQPWKVLSMHKQMNAMQVGQKSNATGWDIFEYAREAGALVITAHEHSYHRTHVLSDMSEQTVSDSTSPYVIRPGETLTAVSGLGGRSIRNQDRCLPTTPPYGCHGEWASIYTSDQRATYGALFIEFHVGGDPQEAHGWFRNIDGVVIDDFLMHSEGLVATGVPTRSGQ